MATIETIDGKPWIVPSIVDLEVLQEVINFYIDDEKEHYYSSTERPFSNHIYFKLLFLQRNLLDKG